jgi:hypothetical protein
MLAVLLALFAHDEKIVVSNVRVSDREVHWRIDVGIARLERAVTFPTEAVDLSERQLQSVKADVVRFLLSRMKLVVDGKEAVLEAGPLEPGYETFIATGEPYIAHVRQAFVYRAEAPVERISATLDFHTDLPGSRVLANCLWGEEIGAPKVLKEPATLEYRKGALNPTIWGTAWEFLGWGMHHIFVGYDHIAFLLALLLGAKRMGEMLKIVTSFTVAHSLTLLLAAFDRIRMPGEVTEAMIAASIVYVAVENFFIRDAKHRWVLTFLFGLVHGLGFSGVLKEKLGEINSPVVPILTFNLGVEFGQVAILLVAFPLLVWARGGVGDKAVERRHLVLLRAGSVPVMLFGLGWLIERVFGLGFMPL